MLKTRFHDPIHDSLDELTSIRRDLHANPELGYQEVRTSQIIQRELSALSIDFVPNLAGGTGVLAHIPATPGAAPSADAVALRADMDALPIHEETGLDHASRTPGVMHACGHDGHTAMLLGAARVLTQIDDRPNPVTLIFQPAEEGGGGGDRMCQEGALDGSIIGPPASRIFGLHGWPTLTVGEVATRPGPLLAAVDTFQVKIEGVGAHAAWPHLSADPVLCAAHCITAIQSIVARNVDPRDKAVVTVAAIHAGNADNVIPTHANFLGTVRTHDDNTRRVIRDRFHTLIQQTAAALGCHAAIEWTPGYPVTNNHPGLTNHFLSTARDLFGEDRVSVLEYPSMGGEDFAYYGKHIPACFFLIGLCPHNETAPPMLHQPNFDFNDSALPVGIELFCELATRPGA